jgi:hypothetical protein
MAATKQPLQIFKEEHDDVLIARKVTGVPGALQFAVDSGTSTTLYLASAKVASDTSDPVWQIQRFTTASGVQNTWADGNAAYDNVWDNRESLSYS